MAYKLLGVVVWKGGKWFLARRYGHLVPPRALVAGVVLVVGVAIAGAAARDHGSHG